MPDPKARYEVGYGKPPKNTQFKKGQSGNGKGRPKVQKTMAMVYREELEKQILMMLNGEQQKISVKRAMAKIIIKEALGGSISHIKYLDTQIAPIEDPANIEREEQRHLEFARNGDDARERIKKRLNLIAERLALSKNENEPEEE